MSFKFENLFDEAPKEADLEALNGKLKVIGDSARKCLATADFAQYKLQFEAAREAILDAMIVYTNNFTSKDTGDVAMYALKMARYVQKVNDLKVLLTQVELDTRKGLRQDEI